MDIVLVPDPPLNSLSTRPPMDIVSVPDPIFLQKMLVYMQSTIITYSTVWSLSALFIQIFCGECSQYLAPLRYKNNKLGRVCQTCYDKISQGMCVCLVLCLFCLCVCLSVCLLQHYKQKLVVKALLPLTLGPETHHIIAQAPIPKFKVMDVTVLAQ